VKVAKNKLAAPFRIANFDIVYGKGVSKVGEIVDIGVDNDIIGKSGSWYSYDGSKIAQGRESAKIFLEDNPEVAFEIEQKIKAAILGTAAGDADTETKKDAKKKKDSKATKS